METTFTAKVDEPVSPRTRVFLEVLRRALIMILNALEDYLEMPRSIRKERER